MSIRPNTGGLTAAALAQGYVQDLERGYWLPRAGIKAWSYSDGREVEARLLDIVSAASDVSALSPELAARANDWVTRYHLSPVRSNLLRPLEQELSGAVLEVGAGCGALTRFIGETAASVVALEPSPARASVAAARCRDLKNVSVVVDSLESFKATEPFQAVTLVGVLEYAGRFGGPGTAARWLERCAGLLADDGCLVLAIENQLGLKYFSGAPEDHAGTAMHGVADLYKADETRTFGRRELIEMLHRVGFGSVTTCLPLPDYKFPQSILLPAAFESSDFDFSEFCAATVVADEQQPIPPLFALDRTWRVLARNAVLPDLANSLLLVCRKGKAEPVERSILNGKVLATHYATDRLPCFAKATQFVREREVIRVRRSRLGPPPKQGSLSHDVRDEAYVRGVNWASVLSDAVSLPGWRENDVADWARRWLLELERCLSADKVPRAKQKGVRLVPGRYVDFLPQNLIVQNEERAAFIDTEWSWSEFVPFDVLAFRGLFHSFRRLPGVGKPGDDRLQFIVNACLESLRALGVYCRESLCAEFLRLEHSIHAEVHGTARRIQLDELLASRLPVFPDIGTYLRQQRPPAVTYDELSERVAQLEAQLAQTDAALNQAREQALQRLERIHELEARLERTDAALEETKSQAFERLTRIEGLERRIEETEAALERTKGEAIQRLSRVHELERRLKETDAALDDTKNQASDRLARVHALESRVAETDQALERTKSQALQRLTRIVELERRIEETDAALERTKEEAIQRLSRIHELERRLEETDAALDDTKNQALERLERIHALEARLIDTDAALEATKTQALERLATIRVVECRLAETQRQLVEKANLERQLTSRVGELEREIEEENSKVHRLERRCEETSEELQRTRSRLERSIVRTEELESTVEAMEQRAGEADANLHKCRMEVERLISDRDALERGYRAESLLRLELEKAKARLDAQLVEARAHLEATHVRLEAILASRSWRYTSPLRRVASIIRGKKSPDFRGSEEA